MNTATRDNRHEQFLFSTVNATGETQPALEQKTYEWILHPIIDLLFCCGGLVWILFGIHFFLLGPKSTNICAQSLITLGALATIFLGETHTIASLTRLYGEKRFAGKNKYLMTVLPLFFSALALVACSHKEIPPILAKIYMLIVSQHFTKQTYGIVLLYCLKRDFKMNDWDKRLLAWLMQATMMFAIVRQLTFKSWSGEEFLGQKLPFWGPLPECILTASTFALITIAIVFSIRLAYRYVSTNELFPLPATLLTFTGVAIFACNQQFAGTLWIYAPAFFHGSQYLAITTAAYLKQQEEYAKTSPHQISSLLLESKAKRYFGFLSISAIAVFVGVPNILAQFGFNYAAAVATIFTTVQFHHVIVDHFIWRMKDQPTRELLI